MHQPPDQITQQDLELAPSHIPDDTAELIRMVRIIACEATSAMPGVSGSVTAIAERTGYSVATVQAIMARPDYRELFERSLRDRAVAVMHAGVDMLEELIRNTEEKPTTRINAHRALVSTYAAVAGAKPNQEAATGAEAFAALMGEIARHKEETRLAQRVHRITIEDPHAPSLQQAHRSEGTAQRDDEGGSSAPQ